MVIDYVIELPCEPKRRFGSEGLRELLRQIEAARRESRASRSASVAREAAASARSAGFQLRPVAYHCSRCPANHCRQSFGCFGAIHGPISAEAEEWLISRFPARLAPRDDDPPEWTGQVEPLRELIRVFQELGISGASFDERRKKSQAVERKKPVRRNYGSLFRPYAVTSSQLLHLLLYRGRIDADTAERLCRALGVWQDGEPDEDGVPVVVFTEPVMSDDDPSVAELKRLLHALIIACSLGAEVSTLIRSEDPATPPAPVEAGARP